MVKYSPDQLLVLASRFLKLAQSDQTELVSESFKQAMSYVFGINPTPEEWNEWLDTNRTAVGNLVNNTWWVLNNKSIFTALAEDTATISNSPDLPNKEFKRKTFAVLRPHPPIPQLWLQIGAREDGPSPSLPPELGHYGWLLDGIDKIIGIRNKQEVIDFLSKNRSKIDRVRRSFETQNPEYLGGGADGAAYNIGGGKVLKLFRDVTSYEKALAAFDRLHKSPSLSKTEAMIYDVGDLGEFGRRHVYYYIMEKMTPVRDLFGGAWNTPVSRILTFIAEQLNLIKGSKLKALKKAIQDPSKAELIRKVVKEEARRISVLIRADEILGAEALDVKDTMPTLKDNWLELYVEEVIMKYLTGRTDLHQGNLGLTDYGELRYYDPAYGGHESEINI